MSQRSPSRNLACLIEANAPLWAGEAEVFRAYWDSPVRNEGTDRLWLLRQAYKEYWDGFVPHLAAVNQLMGDAHSRDLRRRVHDMVEVAAEEYAHFCLFADLWQALGAADESLSVEWLRQVGDWAENGALMALRQSHRQSHGELGARAHRFTEGGYCTLYRAGMTLLGRGGIDDRIAEACAAVYEEEFDHMLMGIADLDEMNIGADDWQLLQGLSTEQMRCRIRMRNAQFSYPLPEARIRELCRGAAAPLAFDYLRAGFSTAA